MNIYKKLNNEFKVFYLPWFWSFSIALLLCNLLMGGLNFIDPRNALWISGDNRTAYLAQIYFISDEWRLPIGANPRYGMSLSTSLTYSGPPSFIPILMKLAKINPELQFFGVWLFVCLFLQILFGYKIAKKLSSSQVLSLSF